jgi:hypothetical protein
LSYLLFPDDLPQSVLDRDGRKLGNAIQSPTFDFLIDELVTGVRTFGVSAHRAGEVGAGRSSILRGGVLSEPLGLLRFPCSVGDLCFTEAAVQELGPGMIDSIASTARDALSFFHRVLGPIPFQAIVVATRGDHLISEPTFGGPVLVVGPWLTHKYAPGSFGLAFELTREFASIYFAAALRIVGPDANEIVAALGVALALKWASQSASRNDLDSVLHVFQQMALRSLFGDTWLSYQGQLRVRQPAQLALALFAHFQEDSYLALLRKRVSEWYGMTVPSVVAIRELGLTGSTPALRRL